jgi:hypothetical protein
VGHARSDSRDSVDPLAWSMEKYNRESPRNVDELVETLRETHIEENSRSEWAAQTAISGGDIVHVRENMSMSMSGGTQSFQERARRREAERDQGMV